MGKHSQNRAWRAEGKEPSRGSACCQHKRWRQSWDHSGRAFGMGKLSGFKRVRLIARFTHPHPIKNADPNVCQGSDGHAMRFALNSLALVVGKGPGFLQRRLPGKLVQSITQRLQAGKAFVGFGVIATLEGHRSCPSQGLDTVGINVARSVITPLSQQPWSQTLSSTRQRTPDLMIWMRQKKGSDHLIVTSNRFNHDQQLFDQREHQARLSTDYDLGGLQ